MNTVNCILEDAEGFMWFGTQDGLNQYNGYKFSIFKNVSDQSTSLSDNFVVCMFRDHRRKLWIGTINGLNQFDSDTKRYIRYINKPGDPYSLSYNKVNSIHEDHLGNLWIGTENGLNRFDRNTERFIRYFNDPDDPGSLCHNHVSVIYRDHTNVLWIGAQEGGLNKLVPADNQESPPTFIHYTNIPNNSNSLSNDSINSIHEDHLGNLWIGTENGLNRFDRNAERFIRYFSDPDDPGSLCHNWVNTIYLDSTNQLWIGTKNGLNQYDRQMDSFISYKSSAYNPNSLSSDYILAICEDRSGVLWIGTYGGGLNKYIRATKGFVNYQANPDDPNALSNKDVLSIYEDQKGTLWIGTHGGGLNRLDRTKKRNTCYKNSPDNPYSLSNDYIRSICEDKQGILWIGTDGGGLNKFYREKEVFIRYLHNPDDSRSLSHNAIRRIYQDRQGVLWIGTWGGGLNKLVPGSKKGAQPTFINYKNIPGDPKSLSNNYVYSFCEDRSGVLWIGTYGGGLNKLVPSEDEGSPPAFIRYLHNPSNPNSLSDNTVLAIHEDKSGILWIGTNSGGLNKLDKVKEVFTHYRVENGLPNDTIYGILEDNQRNLWLSTNRGISRFNPRTEEFKNFDVSDGLLNYEYWGGAYGQSQKGEMFFGGINGLDAFYPDRIKDNAYIPPVVITDFQIFNKPISIGDKINGRTILNKSITKIEQIELSYRDRDISFEFAALNYVFPEKNQYAYMMEGYDKDWNYIGSRRFATYTNLPPSKYVFKVKGSNNDGVWNEEGVSLGIKVTPPFWKTLWFRGSVVIAFLLLVFVVYQIRTRSIREKSKLLEKLVEERTKELKVINEELKDFAYIVSHDLKAPLRAVSQLTNWISEDYSEVLDKAGKEQISLLRSRVNRMDDLINGILQYSRAGRTEEKKDEVDLNDVVREAKENISPPENINVAIEGKFPAVTVDRVKIGQVFQNLISNAVKYMDKPKGKIKIGCREEKTKWEFYVSDNGPGIEEKYYERIFQIFQTLKARDERESTGVGLSVVKKIVELYGGKIWVESKVGKGSTFFFTLKKH